MVYLAALVLTLLAAQGHGLSLTGNAAADFQAAATTDEFPVIVVVDNGKMVPDVGVPSQVQNSQGSIISGWDIARIFFQYNPESDILAMGVDCFGICGDADGRDGPDTASPQLLGIGGEDLAHLGGTESIAVILDMNPFDSLPPRFIVGVPGGNPVLSSPPGGANALCNSLATQAPDFTYDQCFGLYLYDNFPAVAPAFNFRQRAGINPAATMAYGITANTPDLEVILPNVSEMRAQSGIAFGNRREPWSIAIQAFAGSFQDSGIGEDFLPNQVSYERVDFPCLSFDSCDVCLGDGSSCVDCMGVPNGGNMYDQCGVCAGNNTACTDCMGVVNGGATYDACGVCNGPSQDVCLEPDCLGVIGGDATKDICGVCNGDGTSCLDCTGVLFGTKQYDVCGVCGGNGQTCVVAPAPRKRCCCPGLKCDADRSGYVTKKGSCYCGHGVEWGEYYWYGYGINGHQEVTEGFMGFGATYNTRGQLMPSSNEEFVDQCAVNSGNKDNVKMNMHMHSGDMDNVKMSMHMNMMMGSSHKAANGGKPVAMEGAEW